MSIAMLFQKDIHLTLTSWDGSVEHYYHFLLGFLVPLALVYEKYKKEQNQVRRIYIRSCEIMDQHLLSLNFSKVLICDKKRHRKEALMLKVVEHDNTPVEFIEYFGCDNPKFYNDKVFEKARLVIRQLLINELTEAKEELQKKLLGRGPVVVLINRDRAHEFYATSQSEVKSAGSRRRSIPNFDALAQAVTSQYANTLCVTLENRSLAWQIALFETADVIVAQHGAALANLIWCRPKTTVVEIVPKNLKMQVISKNYFGKLAFCMKLHYKRVDQDGKHKPVNAKTLLKCMPR